MKRPIPGVQIEGQPPEIVLTMLAFGEARNQATEGILSVVQVCLNRAYPDQEVRLAWEADNKGQKAKHEALRPKQFSCFNPDDPNRDLMLTAWRTDAPTWLRCWTVVDLAIHGLAGDPTNGARNYFTTKAPVWAKTWPPSWADPDKGWVQTAVVGDHTFGNAV